MRADEILSHYEEIEQRDWTHALTGAAMLEAQHPEYELWRQGTHARAGVSCVDCHMPHERVGATKVTDHQVESPLLKIDRACQADGVSPDQLAAARRHQRRGIFLLDFVMAENSQGFHADQESARVLALALDELRLGQLALLK